MKTVTVISDLHIGSSVGFCPVRGITLAEGGRYEPSRFQKSTYRSFHNFIEYSQHLGESADTRTLVINGDTIDGFHHNTVALVTNNIQVQEGAAIELLKNIAKEYDQVFVVRGTEAHVQSGAQAEERIAAAIGATPNEDQASWWQLWLDVDGVIFNIAHHISTTSSAAYESSAVMREMTAALVEAGQWGQKLPDVIIRSHRHRYIKVAIPSIRGEIQAVVTPAWQLRTPFIERIDRMRMPHIGGIVCVVENEQCQIYGKIYPFKNGHTVKV